MQRTLAKAVAAAATTAVVEAALGEGPQDQKKAARSANKEAVELLDARWAEEDMVRDYRKRQVLPHVVAGALLAAGLTVELVAFLTGSAFLVSLMVALVTVGTLALIYKVNRDRIPEHRRKWLVAAGVTASTWLTLAASGVDWTMLAALLLADAGFGARWWCENRIGHHATLVKEAPKASGLTDFENRWVAKVATNTSRGVPGARLSNGKTTEAGYSWTVDLCNGETLTEVQGRAANIASLMKLSASAVMFDPLPLKQGVLGDESRIRMQIVTASPVIEPVEYEVPTVTDGRIPLGRYADGRDTAKAPVIVRGGVRHIAVIGSTGSGKSSIINGIAVSLRRNYPVVTLYFDPKGDSSPDLRKNATVARLGLDDAEAFTTAVERICEGRGYESALADRSTFAPSLEQPIYLTIIDECDMLFGLDKMARRWGIISKTARSKGLLLVGASQYGGLKAFGNDELLRSSFAAGSVILMRTASNTSDQLIAPGLPPSRFLPNLPGYAYLAAEGARMAPFRGSILRSSDDASPCQQHVGDLLARYPDVGVDLIGRVALGDLLVPIEEREAANKAMVQAKLAAFMSGNFSQAQQTVVVDADGTDRYGEVIQFPALVPDLVPDSIAGLTPAEQAVYDAIKAGNARPEIGRASCRERV